MLSLSEIAKVLGGEVMHGSSGPYVKAPGKGHSADDRSLSIKLNDKGDDIVLKSFCGDDWQDTKDWIREKIGLPKFQPKKKGANGNGNGSVAPWTFVSEHVYQTAEGKPYLLVKKYIDGHGKKQYPQSHWDGEKLLKGKPKRPKVPYNLPKVIEAQISIPIYFCEGEKDADALIKLGFVATTASEGASAAWDKAMTEYFAGRTVVILPDADIPGRNHAQKVAKALSGTAHGIYVVDLFPGRRDGSDVSNFLEHDPSGEKLAQLAREAPEWTSGAEKQKDEALVIELAGLTGIDYAKRKRETAKALGISVQDLDKVMAERNRASTEPQPDHWSVEPWPEAVSIGVLLSQFRRLFTKHVILPEHGAIAMALWVMHAWTIDAAFVSPFLMFTSPEMRCGKTTALSLLNWTGPRTVMACNISPAAIFRYIDRVHPTLLIDEAETHAQSDETRGILNSGHTRDTAYVIRCDGDSNEPKLFSTWAPKAIASIGRLGATLRDRAIILPMKRKKRTEKVSKLRGRDSEAFKALRQQACRWASDNITILREAKPALPEALNDRAADSWEPLFAIADLAGDEWSAMARAAALALSGDDNETASLGVQLLAAIKKMMEDLSTDRLTSQAIAETLAKDESGPWVAYGKMQRPISPRQVAMLLRPYGIEPDSIRIGGLTPKGYLFAWFKDAFEAYLDVPSSTSATPQQSNNDGPNFHFSYATGGEHVADRKAKKPNNDGSCCGVADRKGGNGKIPESDGETASEPCTAGIAQDCRYCSGPPDGTEVSCSVAGVEVWLHRKCIDSWEAAASTMSAEELLQLYR